MATTKRRKMTVPRFMQAKSDGRRLSMLTAYDFGWARIFDEAGIDSILSVGEMARPVTDGLDLGEGRIAKHFDKHETCAAFLKEHAKAGDLVLVKGSRSASMERVLTEFENLSNA